MAKIDSQSKLIYILGLKQLPKQICSNVEFMGNEYILFPMTARWRRAGPLFFRGEKHKMADAPSSTTKSNTLRELTTI